MTRPPILATLLLLATGLACAAGGGEFRPAETSSKATWFAHLDLAALRDSEIGKQLIDELDGEAKRQLRQFERMLNFHPIEDLTSVTVYGTSKDPEKAVALIRGKFDTERLTGLAQDGDDHVSKQYKGATIHSWKDGKKRIFATIPSDELVIIGPEYDLIKIASDVVSGRGASLDAAKIFGHQKKNHVPIVSASADLGALGSLDIDSSLVRKIRSLYIAAGEKDGELVAYAALKTADSRSAQLVDKMIHGLLALAEASDKVPQDVIEAFHTELSDDGISLEVSLPIKNLKELAAQVEKAAEGLK